MLKSSFVQRIFWFGSYLVDFLLSILERMHFQFNFYGVSHTNICVLALQTVTRTDFVASPTASADAFLQLHANVAHLWSPFYMAHKWGPLFKWTIINHRATCNAFLHNANFKKLQLFLKWIEIKWWNIHFIFTINKSFLMQLHLFGCLRTQLVTMLNLKKKDTRIFWLKKKVQQKLFHYILSFRLNIVSFASSTGRNEYWRWKSQFK